MSTQPTGTVATTGGGEETLATLINRPEYRNRFEDVLGQRAGQFTSSLLSLSMTNMRDVDPRSILAAGMVAASLNLPINQNLGFAFIIAYKDKHRGNKKFAQFQMGYKGFVQLAQRTRQYKFINCCLVYDGELVGYNKLTGELEIDEAKRKNDTVVGYASYFKLTSGFEHAHYMTKDQMVKHAKQYSQAFRNNYGGWVDDFDAMGLKTVLKLNLSKWGVLSVEMEKAFFEDQAVRHDINADPSYLDNPDPIPQAQIGDGPEGDDAPAGTTAAPATEGAAPAAAGTAPATEKPPAEKKGDIKKKPEKKEDKKETPPVKAEGGGKPSLTLVEPQDKQPAAEPKQEKKAEAREIGEHEGKLIAKINEAGYLLSDFLWIAVLNKWLDGPEGYDREEGDPADLDGMSVPEDKAAVFGEPDNFNMIIEQMAGRRARNQAPASE